MSRNDWRRPQNFNTPPDKRRVKITVCYDGSEFCGWQSQNDLPSVQSTLKTCVQKFICSDNVIVVGSGRTDSGVHAKSQVAHIEFPGSCNVPAKAFMPALNALLPFSIRITESSEALPSFHARYSTMAREYRYFWVEAPVHYPFLDKYFCVCEQFPDLDLLNSYAQVLIGTHDFTTFSSSKDLSLSKKRDVYESYFYVTKSIYMQPVLCYCITANAFLYHMVRSLCGTMFSMALKKKEVSDFLNILESKQRSLSGKTAYPGGLYLWRVSYNGQEYDWFEEKYSKGVNVEKQ